MGEGWARHGRGCMITRVGWQELARVARVVASAKGEDRGKLLKQAARSRRRLVRASAKNKEFECHTRLPKHIAGRWPTERGTQTTSAGRALSLLIHTDTQAERGTMGKKPPAWRTPACCGRRSKQPLRPTLDRKESWQLAWQNTCKGKASGWTNGGQTLSGWTTTR